MKAVRIHEYGGPGVLKCTAPTKFVDSLLNIVNN